MPTADEVARSFRISSLWLPVALPLGLILYYGDIERVLMISFANGSLFAPLAIIAFSAVFLGSPRHSVPFLSFLFLVATLCVVFHALFLTGNLGELAIEGAPQGVLDDQEVRDFLSSFPLLTIAPWKVHLSLFAYVLSVLFYSLRLSKNTNSVIVDFSEEH